MITDGVLIIRKTQARLLAFAGVKHYLLASDNEDAMTRTPNSSSDLTQHMLDAAKAAGADQADAVAPGTSVSIDVRNGALEHAERSEGVDIGLRVFIGQRSAIVSGSMCVPTQSQPWQNVPLPWPKRRQRIPIQGWQTRQSFPSARYAEFGNGR